MQDGLGDLFSEGDVMSRETQKQWLRHMALDYLAEINAPLSNLERLAEGSRAMPSPLRRKIRATIRKVEETAEAVHAWPITDRERFQRRSPGRGR
ncbi:MAG: hypothetical protein ABII06_19830 [Pseudomonadota bacterium]